MIAFYGSIITSFFDAVNPPTINAAPSRPSRTNLTHWTDDAIMTSLFNLKNGVFFEDRFLFRGENSARQKVFLLDHKKFLSVSAVPPW